ncbi:hypothetical protein HDU76_007433 [Blyttiomyces sp. JEL0837]|nr:hypothetical protein HDU76_007433 [Blyttiomyces sp. JEL0837]
MACAAKECPLSGKCKYVAEHHKEGAKNGCPLEKSGCPYFEHHKNDESIVDLVQEKGHKCPLEGKCSYYDDVKAGKDVDLSGTECPLADKCPYYDEVKKDNGSNIKDCPLEHACPHFKKDFESGKHAHHAGPGDSHAAGDCPYLKKSKSESGHNEL